MLGPGRISNSLTFPCPSSYMLASKMPLKGEDIWGLLNSDFNFVMEVIACMVMSFSHEDRALIKSLKLSPPQSFAFGELMEVLPYPNSFNSSAVQFLSLHFKTLTQILTIVQSL